MNVIVSVWIISTNGERSQVVSRLQKGYLFLSISCDLYDNSMMAYKMGQFTFKSADFFAASDDESVFFDQRRKHFIAQRALIERPALIGT